MVLTAYFDESGTTDQQTRFTVVGGFIAKPANWDKFHRQWQAEMGTLRRDLSDLTFFHMADCEIGKGAFEPWRNRPELRRYAAIKMAQVVVNHALVGFAASVDRESWSRYSEPKFKRKYGKPYFLCFTECMDKASEWMEDFAPGEAANLVFAEQNRGDDERAREVFDCYGREKARAHLNSLTFEPMAEIAPLQAADMLIYSVNKQRQRDVYGEDTANQIYRTILDELWFNDGVFTEVVLDELAFHEISEGLS